jgi:hypothetical protein
MKNLKMKKYRLFFALLMLLTVGLQSCSNDDGTVNQSDIVGVWSFNSLFVDIEIDGKKLSEYFDFEGDQEFFEEFFTEFFAAAYQEQFADVAIEFKADNTFVSTSDDNETSGSWNLNAEGNQLILNKGKVDEQVYNIVVATENQLSLRLEISETFPLSFDEPEVTSEIVVSIEINLIK